MTAAVNYCSANTNGGVRLTNQRSGSPCVQGQTWGFDRSGIWVDRGCRAEFSVTSETETGAVAAIGRAELSTAPPTMGAATIATLILAAASD